MSTKILYVEDEEFLGKIVKESLEKEGYHVVWEIDGLKVMNHFNSFSPDICILDIMLPNVDGYSLCKQIRKKFPSMPIIFLTAKVETQDLVKGFDAGGTDYIRKPFIIDELWMRVSAVLRRTANKSGNAGTSAAPVYKIGKYNFDYNDVN